MIACIPKSKAMPKSERGSAHRAQTAIYLFPCALINTTQYLKEYYKYPTQCFSTVAGLSCNISVHPALVSEVDCAAKVICLSTHSKHTP